MLPLEDLQAILCEVNLAKNATEIIVFVLKLEENKSFGGKVLSKLANYLNQHVVGNVFDQPTILQTYATDRSILQAMPRLVALPENSEDVRKLLIFASQLAERGFKLPVTVRGTGRDKTGAAIGDGLVISLEKMDKIEEIDFRGRLIRVQPGITLGQLNAALGLQGFMLPVEYDHRTTLGGLIANCPTDDISHKYGGIFPYVERVEAVLPSGELVQFAQYNSHAVMMRASRTDAEGNLYREIEQILERHGDTILDRSTKPFDASGYANITKVRQGHGLNLLPLLFASQGTLSVVTDIILRVEVAKSAERRLMIEVHDLKTTERILNQIAEQDARSLKLYDLGIIRRAAAKGNKPSFFGQEIEPGVLIVASFDDRKRRALHKIQSIRTALPTGTVALAEDEHNSNDFAELQAAVLSFLNDDLAGERTPVLDDVYIPQYKLSEFFDGVREIGEILGQELLIFGSYLTSNYNVRPEFDCRSIDGRRLVIQFLRLYNNLVRSLGGSLTGGSPEGRVKAISTLEDMDAREKNLYLDIKNAFDPQNILNPDVKLGAELKSTIRHLRTVQQSGVTTI